MYHDSFPHDIALILQDPTVELMKKQVTQKAETLKLVFVTVVRAAFVRCGTGQKQSDLHERH